MSASRVGWITPLATGAGAALVTAYDIGVPSPWRDEQATAVAASRTWPQLVDLVTGSTDAVSAAYYALMHLWVGVAGIDPFWLRLPSALAIGLAAAGVVVLGRMLDRTRTGLIAAAILVMLPRVFWAGGEARSYALQIAAVIWLTVLFIGAVRAGRWWRWLAYGAVAAAANWLFLYLALIGIAHLVTLVIVPEWRRRLVPASIALAGAAVASLPIALIGYTQRGQVSWIPPIGPGIVGAVAKDQWFMGSDTFTVVGWMLIAGGVAGILLTRGPTMRRRLLALVLPWLILPTVVIVAVSMIASPTYIDRYLVMSAPAVAVLGAFAVTRMPVIAAAAAVVLVVAAAAGPDIQLRLPAAKGDWGEVPALVESIAEPGDAIYFSTDPSGDELRGLLTFFPEAFSGLDDIAFARPAADAGTLRDSVVPASEAAATLAADQRLITILDDDSDPAAADRASFRRVGMVEFVIGHTGMTTVSLWVHRDT
ncbi:MAG: glycosyltransferase family 39 protein [Pseudolysinimonas sp.]